MIGNLSREHSVALPSRCTACVVTSSYDIRTIKGCDEGLPDGGHCTQACVYRAKDHQQRIGSLRANGCIYQEGRSCAQADHRERAPDRDIAFVPFYLLHLDISRLSCLENSSV